MDQQGFSPQDIDSELIEYIDKYFKTVIINAKRHHYRKSNRLKKHGIIIVELEKYEENLTYDEAGFEEVTCQLVHIKNAQFPIFDQDLADAIAHLKEKQRVILLENIILQIPIKQIASELGISERMVEKHKHNALAAIKEELRKHD